MAEAPKGKPKIYQYHKIEHKCPLRLRVVWVLAADEEEAKAKMIARGYTIGARLGDDFWLNGILSRAFDELIII